MNEQKRPCINKTTIAFIFFAVFCVLTVLVLDKLCKGTFYNNDDTLMRSIAEGTFSGTPDGHLIYIMYILGSLIAGLYKCIPQVNWYDLIALAFHIAAISAIATGIGLFFDRKRGQIGASVISYLLFMGIDTSMMVDSRYTVISSILFSAGTVYLIVWIKDKNNLCLILTIVFLTSSLLYRKEVFLMGVPIALVILLFTLLNLGLPQNIKKVVAFLIPFVSIAIVAFFIEHIAYSSDAWKYYLEFNNSRTELEDYVGVPVYEFSEDEYRSVSMSKADSMVLSRHDISFMDEYTLETSGGLVDASKSYVASANESRGVVYLLSRVKKEFKNTWNQPIVIALFSVGFAGILFSILNRHWISMLSIFALYAYQLVFSCYFLYRDRFPERVWYGLYFMILTSIAIILIQEVRNSSFKGKAKIIVGLSAALLFSFFFKYCLEVQNYRVNYYYKGLYEDSINASADLYEYCLENCNNYYLLDSSVTKNLADTMISNGYKDTPNQIPLSYWTNGSPLFETKKENAGMESLSEALLLRDDVFLIQKEGEDTGWIVNYYSSNGIETTLDVEDTFELGSETAVVLKVTVAET